MALTESPRVSGYNAPRNRPCCAFRAAQPHSSILKKEATMERFKAYVEANRERFLEEL